MKTRRANRGIALHFFNLGASWEWIVSATPWPHYPQEMDPVPNVQEVVWGQGPSGQVGNISPQRDSNPGPSSL